MNWVVYFFGAFGLLFLLSHSISTRVRKPVVSDLTVLLVPLVTLYGSFGIPGTE